MEIYPTQSVPNIWTARWNILPCNANPQISLWDFQTLSETGGKNCLGWSGVNITPPCSPWVKTSSSFVNDISRSAALSWKLSQGKPTKTCKGALHILKAWSCSLCSKRQLDGRMKGRTMKNLFISKNWRPMHYIHMCIYTLLRCMYVYIYICMYGTCIYVY